MGTYWTAYTINTYNKDKTHDTYHKSKNEDKDKNKNDWQDTKHLE